MLVWSGDVTPRKCTKTGTADEAMALKVQQQDDVTHRGVSLTELAREHDQSPWKGPGTYQVQSHS